jgi:hypothetical protein
VVCASDFFFDWSLRVNHSFSLGASERHALPQTGQLHLLRTGHHNYLVAQAFTVGLIKKWNVSEEKFWGIAMAFRLCAPFATNARMEDPLQRAFFGRVSEDYCSKLCSIQVASGRKHLRPELTADLFLYFRPTQKLMGRLVCIEECCRRQKFAQTFDEGAFPGGNPTRNPDRRHEKLSAVQAAMSAAKFRSKVATLPSTLPGRGIFPAVGGSLLIVEMQKSVTEA